MADLNAIQKAAEYFNNNLFREKGHVILIVWRGENRMIIDNFRSGFKAINKMKLSWTRTHVGNLGNQKADHLTNGAARKKYIDLSYHPNKKHSKRVSTISIWRSGNKVGKVTIKVEMSIAIYTRLISARYTDFYPKQVVTGHGAFPAFLNKMFEKSNRCCFGYPLGSAQQFIQDCTKWTHVREQ